MKSKPWIDEVYQDHLAAREIPLDLKHWVQAEALIIAQEKAEKKRRALLWCLLLGAVTIFSFFGWNQYNQSKRIEIKSITPEIKEDTPQPYNPEVAQHTETKSLNHKQTEISQPANNSSQAEVRSPGFSLKNNDPSSSKDRTMVYSPQPETSTKHTLKSPGTKSINQKTIKGSDDKNQKVNNESALLIKQELIHIDALTTAWKLTNPDRNLQLKFTANEISDEPVQIKKSSWKESGVRMTLAQESGLQVSDPSIQHAGFEWFHQKSIRSGLFYGYSLGYKSNFNHSQYAEVITSFQFEGFSSNVQNFGVKPEWMNALYAQGNIGMDFKRNKLFVGIRPEFIIGTKGKVDQLSFKETTGIRDINKASISSINKGWLQSGSLNELSWTLSIGYEYRIMKKLGVGIQIDHSLKSIYRPLDPQIKQQAAAAWNTGFRFSYILN